jgi:hypothetical protein
VIALGCGLAIGTVLGAALTKLASRLRARRTALIPEVPEEERDLIEVNFAAHINHLRDEVSNFADRLAGDDPVLRERLRGFEWGGHS